LVAVARAIDRAVDRREVGPILRNTLGARMDRHAATRRFKHLAATAGIRMPRMHPHMLRHTFVTTMLDADLRIGRAPVGPRLVLDDVVMAVASDTGTLAACVAVPGGGAMAVRSLGWLGVRTSAAAAMNAFYRDVLHLEVILERPEATWYRL